MSKVKTPSPEMIELLKRSGSNDYQVAFAAQRELAKALEMPLKRGVLKGDNLGDIFEDTYFAPGTSVEYPLDFLTPTNVGEFIAYTVPNVGKIKENSVEGDYLSVPTYRIGGSIDWPLYYAENARWDVVGRAYQVMEAQFTRKWNMDGWHVLLAAAAGRNITVYDAQATSGLFTKRLPSLMMTSMRRNAGGNASSIGQGKLTDLWMSPEAAQDMRSWDLTQVDDITRRQIFMTGEGEAALTSIYGVKFHVLDELGVGQEYQGYFTGTLGGSMPTDKVEIVVGLDLLNRDSFMRPNRGPIEIFEDMMLHRQGRAGLYGWHTGGFSALYSARALLGAL